MSAAQQKQQKLVDQRRRMAAHYEGECCGRPASSPVEVPILSSTLHFAPNDTPTLVNKRNMVKARPLMPRSRRMLIRGTKDARWGGLPNEPQTRQRRNANWSCTESGAPSLTKFYLGGGSRGLWIELGSSTCIGRWQPVGLTDGPGPPVRHGCAWPRAYHKHQLWCQRWYKKILYRGPFLIWLGEAYPRACMFDVPCACQNWRLGA